MAITHAQFTLDNLIEAGHYDYYSVGIESRWPHIPIAVGAHTKQGKALLENAIQATKDEFDNNGNAIHNQRELQELLCANNMWVVSADVHI